MLRRLQCENESALNIHCSTYLGRSVHLPNLPVAVASASLKLCIALLCSLNTDCSAEAMVVLSAVWAARAEDRTAALCDACDAAAPERVWAARSDEMMAAARDAAAALATLAEWAIAEARFVAWV